MAIQGKQIASLDASKIGGGVFNVARIPDLATAKITSGTFDNARISQTNVTQHQAQLQLGGGQITSGTVASDRIAVLSTAKITTGTFDNARISQGSVVQHQAALQIDASSQLTNQLADGRVASSNVTQHLSATTLKTPLGQAFPSNALSIGTNADTITIPGNLIVSGTETKINTGTLELNDHNIEFDKDNSTANFANGAGITIVRAGDNLTFTCDGAGLMNLKIGSALSGLNVGSFNATDYNLQASDIPNLATAKITSGTFDNARISQGSVTQHQTQLQIGGGQITNGTVAAARIDNLPASQITSGQFGAARLAANSVLSDKVKWQKVGADGPASPSGDTSNVDISGRASTQSNGVPDGAGAFVFLNGVLLEEAAATNDVGSAGDYFLSDSGNDKRVKLDNALLTDDSDRITIKYIATV